ncbi:7-carboxy-7-deazaguanine synthase QueE [Siphonobacter sp. SORGH_AS_1065]|uniref:7-carboxy-7-deazaguanine synthase QueE n=1 Tax=Siphonobacter sp. SORGH_AS_1065 TaxID=3041795 RepID=UPI00277FF562|nr:7-carboxy-7-deazaguanine synthase QueE [Siphonobacter sp. SORGH_AS_1065]MDQ1089092.1 7-carboxy-7-deazaguanine synthase [Siphonobacter sp. SORGH_AS_1065]
MSEVLIAPQPVQLPVMESFYTLQGEGYHNGKAAYFIRLGGCEVGCHWCDVKESWDASLHPQFTIEAIVKGALQHPGRLAVITGGEPLMHDLTDLTAALQQVGFQTNIETSGVYAVSGSWDWICFSPKKFKEPHPDIYSKANELKVIIYNKSDFEFAEEHAAKLQTDCQLLLQPEWSRHEMMLPQIIAYVKDNPKWRVSLQTHKYMNIP